MREALIEREVLIRLAPHLTRPLRFVLPHHSGLRPAWMLRLGLFLYDHLGGREILPGTELVDLSHHAVGEPLKRNSARPSSTRMAGWTMRVWWCSTRRPSAARWSAPVRA